MLVSASFKALHFREMSWQHSQVSYCFKVWILVTLVTQYLLCRPDREANIYAKTSPSTLSKALKDDRLWSLSDETHSGQEV